MAVGGAKVRATFIDEATPWGKFLAFLTSVGVDVMDARSGDIHIGADATRGVVLVNSYVRDEKGVPVLEGEGDDIHPKMKTGEYFFAREP